MGEMVKVKAKNFGTRNSIVDGGLLHFNPKGSDPRAREREIDERDVQRLVDEDIIVAPKGYRKTPAADTIDTPVETLGDAAERKLKEDAVQVDEPGEAPSPAGNRDNIAYQDPDPAGIAGEELSDDDPDAPPAATARAAAKPRKSS